MPSHDVLTDLASAALDVLQQIVDQVSSVDAFERLLSRHGWATPETQTYFADLSAVFALLNDVPTLAEDVAVLRAASEPDLSEVADTIQAVIKVLNDLNALATLGAHPELPFPINSNTFWNTFPLDVLQTEIVFYLAARRPGIHAVFRVFGLIDEEDFAFDPTVGRLAHTEQRLKWERLGQLFVDPRQLAADVYGWGGQFDHGKLVHFLDAALSGFSMPSQPEAPTDDLVAPYYDPTNPILPALRLLRAPFLLDQDSDAFSFEVGLQLLPVPPAADKAAAPTGLAIAPYFDGAASTDVPLGGRFDLNISAEVASGSLLALILYPGQAVIAAAPGTTTGDFQVSLTAQPDDPFILVGSEDGSRVEIRDATVGLEIKGDFASPEVRLRLGTSEVRVVVEIDEADGFLGDLFGNLDIDARAAAAVLWSSKNGLSFEGSGKLQFDHPVQLTLGPVAITNVAVAIGGANGSTQGTLTVTASAALGPVTVAVQNVGLSLTATKVADGAPRGILGDLDLSFGFAPPNGVGLAVDAGPVHGGGFISFDPTAGRYSGALQLSIYDIAVNAFGLIDTKVPNVDFSFVIIISAEFTPIQLGLGFTLNGVGGMVGINRGIDTNALSALVRAGQSEELLFPKNVVADAPTIVRDLTSVFPATQGRYVFGPLAKLGWGTPTLITAEIGVVLEIPGPIVVILGEVKCLLPKPDAALVKLNLSVDGELDFPKKSFSLDAALHDSVINGLPVSGQMAMRLNWGGQPNFVLSIGGFHPAYTPPPNFPKLQPLALDLGSHGPATITVSGFFAVTSNTVQVGGAARLHAGGSGISLDASVSVKALFVFTPFSFEADIDASVKISFHGYGPSVHLSGVLEGPSPWHVKGEVCVSILWWDACLGFDVTFGGNQQVTQPEIDPWLGIDASQPGGPLPGLQAALSDAGSWSGAALPGAVSPVTRAQGTQALVDPVGGLTVRQKVAPVETSNPLTKFGVARVAKPVSFSNVQATLGTGSTVSLTPVEATNEFFAPAQFFDMNDAKKLSSAGFESYQAGYLFATAASPKNVQAGSSTPKTLAYNTFVIGGDGTITGPQQTPPPPNDNAQVTAANTRSAVTRGGVTLAGTRRFINPSLAQAFTEQLPTFVISSNTTLTVATGAPAAAVRSATLIALDGFRAQNLEQAASFQVSAFHELA